MDIRLKNIGEFAVEYGIPWQELVTEEEMRDINGILATMRTILKKAGRKTLPDEYWGIKLVSQLGPKNVYLDFILKFIQI